MEALFLFCLFHSKFFQNQNLFFFLKTLGKKLKYSSLTTPCFLIVESKNNIS